MADLCELDTARLVSEQAEKEPAVLAVAACGPHQAGKSTVVGRLLVELGVVGPVEIQDIEDDAKELGKEPDDVKYGWISDTLEEEREEGRSFESSLLGLMTSSHQCRCTLVDTPGHPALTQRAVSAAAQADCCLIIVDATAPPAAAGGKDTEASGGEGAVRFDQADEYILLAFAMGVTQLVIAVNKMDKTEPPYSEEVFASVSADLADFAKKVGFHADKTHFVPTSGRAGDNMAGPGGGEGSRTPWHKGPSLETALERCNPRRRAADAPLRLAVQGAEPCESGEMYFGRVVSGVLREGCSVTVAPILGGAGRGAAAWGVTCGKGTVRDVEAGGSSSPEAPAGSLARFFLEGGMRVNPGAVVSDADDPAMPCESFVAQVIVRAQPGKSQISEGDELDLLCLTSKVVVRVVELQSKMDRRSGKEADRGAEGSLQAGEAGFIKIAPLEPLCVEPVAHHPALGRFLLQHERATVAFGVVKTAYKIFPFEDAP